MDWWMLSPIILGTLLRAIGFPVISDLSLFNTPQMGPAYKTHTFDIHSSGFLWHHRFAFTEWTNSAALVILIFPRDC